MSKEPTGSCYLTVLDRLAAHGPWLELPTPAPETKCVWMNILAIADRKGFFCKCPALLGGFEKIDPALCEEIVRELEKPRANSEGPYLINADTEEWRFRWQIANFERIVDAFRSDRAKIQVRDRVRRLREEAPVSPL